MEDPNSPGSGRGKRGFSMAQLNKSNEKTPLRHMLIFGIPRFTVRAAYIVTGVWVVTFYESIGAKLLYLSAYIALGRGLDVLTDPLMGWVTENFSWKWGNKKYNRKPFMSIGGIFYALCLILLCSPPRQLASTMGLNHWFGVFYLGLFIFDTISSIPYYAFGMELPVNPQEMQEVWFWNLNFGHIGTFFGMAMPFGLSLFFDIYTSYIMVGVAFASVHFIGMMSTVLFVPERRAETIADKTPPEKTEPEDPKTPSPKSGEPAKSIILENNCSAETVPIDLTVGFLRLFRSSPFNIIVVSFFLDFLSVGLIGAMLPFYAGYVLDEPSGDDVDDIQVRTNIMGYMAVSLFGATIASVPVWYWIANKFGKYKAWIAYSVWNSVTCPFFVFCGTGATTAAMIISALNGTAAGGQFLVEAMINDVIVYDEFLYGDSAAGLFVSVNTFIPKMVVGAALSLPLACIAAAGYLSPICPPNEFGAIPDTCEELAPQPQPQSIRWVITIFFSVIPTLATLVSVYWKLSFPITTPEIATALHVGIESHKAGQEVEDPCTRQKVGPLCISRIPKVDTRRRTAMLALAHFPLKTVRKLKENGIDPDYMKPHLHCLAYGCTAAMVTCFVTAIFTVGLLNDNSKGWIPIFAFIFSGGLVVFVYLFFKILGQVKVLKTLVDEDKAGMSVYIDDYLAKWVEAPVGGGPVAGKGATDMNVAGKGTPI